MNLAQLRNLAQGLAKGPLKGFMRPVTIRNQVASDYNPSAGVYDQAWEELQVRAAVMGEVQKTDEEAGDIRERQVVFLYPLPSISKKSRVVVDGAEYGVFEIEGDPAGASLTITLRL